MATRAQSVSLTAAELHSQYAEQLTSEPLCGISSGHGLSKALAELGIHASKDACLTWLRKYRRVTNSVSLSAEELQRSYSEQLRSEPLCGISSGYLLPIGDSIEGEQCERGYLSVSDDDDDGPRMESAQNDVWQEGCSTDEERDAVCTYFREADLE